MQSRTLPKTKNGMARSPCEQAISSPCLFVPPTQPQSHTLDLTFFFFLTRFFFFRKIFRKSMAAQAETKVNSTQVGYGAIPFSIFGTNGICTNETMRGNEGIMRPTSAPRPMRADLNNPVEYPWDLWYTMGTGTASVVVRAIRPTIM